MTIMFIFHIIQSRVSKSDKYSYSLRRKKSVDLTNSNSFEMKRTVYFDDKFMATVLYVIWLAIFVYECIYLKGNIIIDKTKLPRGTFGRINTVYYFTLIFSMVTNYKLNRWKMFIFQVPALIISYLQNYRTFVVLLLVAIFINEILVKNKVILKLKHYLFVFLIFILAFFGKSTIGYLRIGVPLSTILSDVIFNLDSLKLHIESSEPFVTQFILNHTINNNFKLAFSYILRIIFRMFFISPELTNIPSFYEQFTLTFFPEIDYGIAYNLFSVPYAIAGMLGIIICTILYGLSLRIINKKIYSDNKIVSSMFLVLSSVYSMYIFRNDIENVILWTQILFSVFFICYVMQFIRDGFKIRLVTQKSIKSN